MAVFSADLCDSLLLLLKASAKDQVAKTCELAFDCLVGASQIEEAVMSPSMPPDTSNEEREKLLKSLIEVFEKSLGLEAAAIAENFPADFHRQLRDLIIRIILQRQQDWTSKIAKARAGIPWLRSFSCSPMELHSGDSYVGMNIEIGSGAPTSTPRSLALTIKSSNMGNITGKLRQLADQLETIANR